MAISADVKTAAEPMFIPSSAKLVDMIESAMKRFDCDREQSLMREDARQDALAVRAQVNQAKARHYARLQRGR